MADPHVAIPASLFGPSHFGEPSDPLSGQERIPGRVVEHIAHAWALRQLVVLRPSTTPSSSIRALCWRALDLHCGKDLASLRPSVIKRSFTAAPRK